MPLIADVFGVSIDYLYYGSEMTYDEIYEKVFQKVCGFSEQMSREAYEDVLKIFGYAHYGVVKGSLRGGDSVIYDEPNHISNENGLSLLSGKGYGVILTRNFFENISLNTVDFAQTILPTLSKGNNLLVCMTILSMSDISFGELQTKLGFAEETLREALDGLIGAKLVTEKESKHKSLGFTYEINSMYHTCLCILIATLEMQRYSLDGVSCCMGYGDYPINI